MKTFFQFFVFVLSVHSAGASEAEKAGPPVAGASTALPVSSAASAAGAISAPSEPQMIRGVPVKEISGTVRLIRANPETEVFFKDLKDSLIIPKDSKHNQIFEACQQSQKTGRPVQIMVDPAGRRILGLPGAKSPSPSTGADEATPY